MAAHLSEAKWLAPASRRRGFLSKARKAHKEKAMHHMVDDFQIGDRAMRYSLFVPRLYNDCLSLGFERARLMPSRAFCSDESQGYPVIFIMQHFGAFPFDHGRVVGQGRNQPARPPCPPRRGSSHHSGEPRRIRPGRQAIRRL